MQIRKFLAIVTVIIGPLILIPQSKAQERFKTIRITYPTESIIQSLWSISRSSLR